MPTPSRNRPSSIDEDVAAAWARIAGWMRSIGQVTAVVTSRPVVAAMPPITDHTNGDSPWLSIHGWKWSEIVTVSNPARSAICACSTRARGPFSSEDKKHPNVVIAHRLLCRTPWIDLEARRYPPSPVPTPPKCRLRRCIVGYAAAMAKNGTKT